MTTTSFPFDPRYQFYDSNGQVIILTNPILHRFLHDLWNKTGAASDYIKPAISIATSDVTTTTDQIVIATTAITVTLNPTPKNGERVTVKRNNTDGLVTVSGSIDGDSSFLMLFNYDSYTFHYSTLNSEWSII